MASIIKVDTIKDTSDNTLLTSSSGNVSISDKLATTSTGIDVTGTVVSDGLTVDGDARINGTSGKLTYVNDVAGWTVRMDAGDAGLYIKSGVGSPINRLNIEATGDISFYEDTGTTPKLFWDASAESLGIGTSSPSSFDQVGADDLVIGGGASGHGITLYTGTASSGGIAFADGTTTTDQYRGRLIYAHGNDSMRFFTSASERMRIDSSGNVGIGDTTPDATLDVVGNIHYTGGITDVSDRRLKENITDLSDSLNKICQLNAKSYTLIADRNNEEDTTELGFIAQDVQTIYPEIVKNIQKYAVDENGENTEEEINYLGVSYIQLIAPMVEAIKELKADNDALRARIETLENA